jgi:hypothetical protein
MIRKSRRRVPLLLTVCVVFGLAAGYAIAEGAASPQAARPRVDRSRLTPSDQARLAADARSARSARAASEAAAVAFASLQAAAAREAARVTAAERAQASETKRARLFQARLKLAIKLYQARLKVAIKKRKARLANSRMSKLANSLVAAETGAIVAADRYGATANRAAAQQALDIAAADTAEGRRYQQLESASAAHEDISAVRLQAAAEKLEATAAQQILAAKAAREAAARRTRR